MSNIINSNYIDEEKSRPNHFNYNIRKAATPLTEDELLSLLKQAREQQPEDSQYKIPENVLPRLAMRHFISLEKYIHRLDTEHTHYQMDEIERTEMDKAADEIDNLLSKLNADIIMDLTCKLNELYDMTFPDKPHEPLSLGNLKNVGLTVMRRCFFVAHKHKQLKNDPNAKIDTDPSTMYPFLTVKPELLDYLYSLFMRMREIHCNHLLPAYAFGCLLICAYNPRQVKIDNPRLPHIVHQYYDEVFELLDDLGIHVEDHRKKSNKSK